MPSSGNLVMTNDKASLEAELELRPKLVIRENASFSAR